MNVKRIPRIGISLVEVLIVISIISLLLQLLLPAVQSAREAARRLSCGNNLRQIGIASLCHESSHNFFPSGGWTHVWVGDPNRGFRERQPGGWCYNLLPYVEEETLHDLGKGSTGEELRRHGTDMFQTPVSVLVCPSRRDVASWPFLRGKTMINIGNAQVAGRSDYAGNIGNLQPSDQRARGPSSYKEADEIWKDGTDLNSEWVATDHNGMIFQRSRVRNRDVKDGLSKTFLIGEKFLAPEHYTNGESNGDDHSLYVGFDRDNARSTNPLHPPLQDKNVPNVWLPIGDSVHVTDWNFGSSHAAGCQFVYGDGSVHLTPYDVDKSVFVQMGSRSSKSE